MTCESRPALLLEQKTPDEIDWRGVTFAKDLVNWIGRGQALSLSARGRFASSSGYEFECTIAGVTGQREPILPTTEGATVKDGSATLTCRAVSSASLRATIASVDWDAPAEITVTNEVIQDTEVRATLAGGVDGQDYEISVQATLSNGNVLEEFCILPVRVPAKGQCCA